MSGSNPARRSGRTASRHGARYPRGWEISTDDTETALVTLPPDVTRMTASMRLAIEAEFGGWELSRVRLYSDGTRKVLLTRKKPRAGDLARRQSRPLSHPPHTAHPPHSPENETRAC